MRSFVEAV